MTIWRCRICGIGVNKSDSGKIFGHVELHHGDILMDAVIEKFYIESKKKNEMNADELRELEKLEARKWECIDWLHKTMEGLGKRNYFDMMEGVKEANGNRWYDSDIIDAWDYLNSWMGKYIRGESTDRGYLYYAVGDTSHTQTTKQVRV